MNIIVLFKIKDCGKIMEYVMKSEDVDAEIQKNLPKDFCTSNSNASQVFNIAVDKFLEFKCIHTSVTE